MMEQERAMPAQDRAPQSAERKSALGIDLDLRGRILVVDDERNIRATLRMTLAGFGLDIDLAADGGEAETILATTLPDLILLDVRLPGASGLELLKRWKLQHPQIPIVLMSGEASLGEAVDGLKDGAYDFIEKPFLTPRLINTIARALERQRLKERDEPRPDYEIIGQSPALCQVLRDLEKVAPTKSRVLITGESGTGKDLLARAIHQHSPRAKERFAKINCAAIPAELIESELFGHVKGAFTGATTARRGYFEVAHGGTLFLDEIGDLSLAAQAKILRALQNGEITPVGSNKTLAVDVRVVAATNKDLKAAVEQGTFREDLYYRLAVLTIESPPLRRRLEDVPLLVRHFAKMIAGENGLPSKVVSEDVMTALCSYGWPGNVRELRNVIERLLILGDALITLDDLPHEIRQGASSNSVDLADAGRGVLGDDILAIGSWDEFKRRSERAYLITVLRHADGNISHAARILGIERSTVHKWLKLHHVDKIDYLRGAEV